MKKIVLIPLLFILVQCNSNSIKGKYTCKKSNGKFGSTLNFKNEGKVFLDLVSTELVDRNPSLGKMLNVSGEYEIIDDKIIIKYFNGYQTHTLTKEGENLISGSEIFKICTCDKK